MKEYNVLEYEPNIFGIEARAISLGLMLQAFNLKNLREFPGRFLGGDAPRFDVAPSACGEVIEPKGLIHLNLRHRLKI